MTIGERIKNRRNELGMTQEELALQLGYKGKSSINKIEKGHQQLTQRKIKQIANALDTTTDYIMGWDEQSDRLKHLEHYCEFLTDDEMQDVENMVKRMYEYHRKLGELSK